MEGWLAVIESLDIANLGVIASAHVDFGGGLIVVTGETGAGKTMVLSSLQLLLGARADAALVRSGADRLSVDGIFSVGDDVASRVEEAGGVVEGGELIVGRSVRAAGRSRAHLGSRPVPASALSEIVGSMVTIHGQSDQIRLTGEAAQRRALDQFGGAAHAALLEEYREAFREAVDTKHRLDSLRGDANERAEELEDLRGALAQIDALNPQPGEEEELIREASRLTNVEDLRALMGVSLGYLTGDDRGDYAGAVESARPTTCPPTSHASTPIPSVWPRSTPVARPSRTRCAGAPATLSPCWRGPTRRAGAWRSCRPRPRIQRWSSASSRRRRAAFLTSARA